MEPWCRSNITPQRLEGLVCRGFVRPLTTAEEWWLSDDEDEPSPPKGYVVSFAYFHERGFAIPAHLFLWKAWRAKLKTWFSLEGLVS